MQTAKRLQVLGWIVVGIFLGAVVLPGCTTYSPSVDGEGMELHRDVFPATTLLISVNAATEGAPPIIAATDKPTFGFDRADLRRAIVNEINASDDVSFHIEDDSTAVNVNVEILSDRRTHWLGIIATGFTYGLLPVPTATFDLSLRVSVVANSQDIVTFSSQEKSRQFWMGAISPFFFAFEDASEKLAKRVLIGLEEAFSRKAVQQKLSRALSEDPAPKATIPEGGGSQLTGTGTAFAINDTGTLVTNFHVIEGARSLTIIDGNKEIPVRVLAVDQTLDIAILKGEFESAPVNIADEPATLGQDVFTIGFPNPNIQGVSPKYTDGTISSLRGVHDDPRVYQISVPLQPGNSGGPIVSYSGSLVGVAVASLDAAATFEAAGALPQNVNYAVKGTRLKTFLEESGIAFVQGGASSEMNETELINHIQQRVFMVFNYQ